jgi:hypothetical protein
MHNLDHCPWSEWPDWANFRSLGDCLLWAVFENCRSSPYFWATFPPHLWLCISFDKNVLGYLRFGRYFLQTLLVTLSLMDIHTSGWPDWSNFRTLGDWFHRESFWKWQMWQKNLSTFCRRERYAIILTKNRFCFICLHRVTFSQTHPSHPGRTSEARVSLESSMRWIGVPLLHSINFTDVVKVAF